MRYDLASVNTTSSNERFSCLESSQLQGNAQCVFDSAMLVVSELHESPEQLS
jgi:hypothetical protein